MTKNTETLESWNKVADLYNEKFTDLQLYNHTYDLFIEHLPYGYSKILDIACGPGRSKNIVKIHITSPFLLPPAHKSDNQNYPDSTSSDL